VDPKADLRELERTRKGLLRERDAEGLERLAGDAAALPQSGARDRLVYAARQNAAYARRAAPDESRGLLIGAIVLAALVVAGIAAVGAFADWSGNGTYRLYNDRAETVSVWSCTEECSYYAEADEAGPGEAVDLFLAERGDVYLVAGDDGRVLGCITLPPGTSSGTTTVNLSDARACPAAAPSSVG
jgi:hypothetical protein